MEDNSKGEVKRILRLFKYAYTNKNKYKALKEADEELYYSDVDGNRTQFTNIQLSKLKDKFGIAISTKFAFPIIQQMLSFLSGSKPYPKLVTSEEPFRGFALSNERLVKHVWYESEADQALVNAIEQMLIRGSGWLHVRGNSFYEESSLGTIVEQVPDQEIFVDPMCRDMNIKDADFAFIAKALPIVRAEREWGIKISNDIEGSTFDVNVPDCDIPAGYDDGLTDSHDIDQNYRTRFVWEKILYEKLKVKSFISEEGISTFEAPKPAQRPNLRKLETLQQLSQVKNEILQQMAQAQVSSSQGAPQEMVGGQQQQVQGSQQLMEINEAIATVVALPDYINGFEMKQANGELVFVEKYIVKQTIQVKRSIVVNTTLVEQKVLDTDVIPLHHFGFAMYKKLNNSFGVVHFIKDIMKALNKMWGLIIYDLQLRSSFRILSPENAINDQTTWEKHFSVPGSINTYRPDPMLQNGGKPEIMNTGDVNASLPQFISMLVQLGEYITGIYGVLQGNDNNAPGTFGATQSLQSFGTQRIKMASRSIETSLAGLVYSIVRSLQATVTSEAINKFFSDDPQILEEFKTIGTDTRFKARMIVTNSLPTAQQMAAQMFTILAGQVQDPNVQRLLIESGIKFLDIREADELLQKLDTMKSMEQNMQQMQAENENLQGQLRAAQNNLAQKDIAMQAKESQIQIKERAAKEMAVNKMQAQMDAQQEQPEESEEDIVPPGEIIG